MMSKGELTRNRIIAEAAPLFNTQGFAGASMQDVMEATGLEKGGLYRHFSSKEELAVEAFRYAMSNSARLRTEKLDRTHGALEQLRSIVRRFVEAPSAIKGGCPLMNTAIDSDDGNQKLRALVSEAFAEWRDRLCEVVQEGLASGEIRKKTAPRRIANTMIATLEGALMLSRLDGTKTALADAQVSLEALFESIARTEFKAHKESKAD
jgi:TetR/AcrR family transcriptional repressor of nem operon